jgi:hypothetical protein
MILSSWRCSAVWKIRFRASLENGFGHVENVRLYLVAHNRQRVRAAACLGRTAGAEAEVEGDVFLGPERYSPAPPVDGAAAVGVLDRGHEIGPVETPLCDTKV